MGKPVQLALGRSHSEWERGDCGMFLYWHGRLIEAYKRVGGMVKNKDKSRGLIGVIDVTNVKVDRKGNVLVHKNKQGFRDCEIYVQLERWLGRNADEYLLKAGVTPYPYKPDYKWVQCDKCRKWRRFTPGSVVSQKWLCSMELLNGKCEVPEEKVESGDFTSPSKRSKYHLLDKASCSSRRPPHGYS